jgi:hypothetical protein
MKSKKILIFSLVCLVISVIASGLVLHPRREARSSQTDAQQAVEVKNQMQKLDEAKAKVIASEGRLRATLLYRIITGKPVPTGLTDTQIAAVAARATPTQQHQAELFIAQAEEEPTKK